MSTTFSATVVTPKVTSTSASGSGSSLGLLDAYGTCKLLFEKTVRQGCKPAQLEPLEPRYLSEGTILTDPELVKIAFEMVAEEEGGTLTTEVEGIEDEVNRRMVTVLKTSKIKEGLGLVKWEKTAAIYWNRNSHPLEVKKLKQKLEDTYLTLLINEILKGEGYEVICSSSGKAIVLEAYGLGREEITLLIEEGKITGDLEGFQGCNCIEMVERLRLFLREAGIGLADIDHEPKSDDAGGIELNDGEKIGD